MSRVAAAVSAVLVSLATFGLALFFVRWLLGSGAFFETVTSRWFFAAVIFFSGIAVSLVLVIVAIRDKRAAKSAEQDRPGLLSASERLRRDVERGRQGR
jgi:hypothetical protein